MSKHLDGRLERDLATPASRAFEVLVVRLDSGPLSLAARGGALGSDTLLPAVLSLGDVSSQGASVTVEKQALPDYAQDQWWLNRDATILECTPDMGSIYDGAIVFAGIVTAQPTELAGVLSLTLGPARARVVTVPDFGVIDVGAWPRATVAAMGQLKPLIFGTVEDCPLLAVDLPAATTLSSDALDGANHLEVADGAQLTASGAVWLDGETYTYSARSGSLLLGMAIRRDHRSGTAVIQAAPATFLAAGHAVASIADLKAGATRLPMATAAVDLAAATVSFAEPPTVVTATQRQTYQMQFDRADAGGSIQQGYPVQYPVAYSNENGYVAYADLDTLIVPPQNLVAGSYAVTITWAAQGNVAIDNPVAYSGTLNGLPFTLTKAAGSAQVTLPCAGGVALRLKHPTNTLGADAVPLITGASATWVTGSNPKPALNAVNAIQAATGTVTQNAVTLPHGVISSSPGVAAFARPNQDHIIAGAYQVAFAVTVAAQVGWARVKVGDDVVWFWDQGVVYNYSPATVEWDTDSDSLPVNVEVEQGGSADQVRVDVLSASRTVVTGNLDQANYATLRKPNNTTLRVDQLTDHPDLGPIASARLMVEFFTAATALDKVDVKFGGQSLGKLSLSNAASGGTVSKTISVDTISNATANLISNAISNALSSTVNRSDNAVPVPINVPVSYSTAKTTSTTAGTTATVLLFPLDIYIALPAGVVGGTYAFYLYLNPHAQAGIWGSNVYEVNGQQQSLFQDATPPYLQFNVTLTDNQQNVRIRHGSSSIGNWPSVALDPTVQALVKHVSASVYAKPSRDAISISGGAVSGSSTVVNTAATVGTLAPVARVDGTPGGGNLQFTIPTPPRTIVNVFELPAYRDWANFTGQQLELAYNGASTEDVAIVQCWIEVDFDLETRELAGTPNAPLTATVAGLSGNPADVIAYLAGKTGQALAAAPWRELAAWCVANGYLYGRRINTASDALQMLNFAAEQANVLLADTDAGLALVRRLDRSPIPVQITDADLLDQPRYGWTTRADNDITINYREDYSGSAGFSRALHIGAGSNAACRAGLAAAGAVQAVSIDAGFICDDAVAARFGADTAKLDAVPRRTVTLDLPYSFAATEIGDLVEFAEILWRVMPGSSRNNGFVALQCEEVPR